jgi:hypothetical protein
MNDDELERALRSQQGPREAGYTPTPLPSTLDLTRNARPSRLMRIGILVPAAVAGALAVAVAGSILSETGPGPGGTSGSPQPSASGAATACAPADVVFSAEPWGGAAGSRGTVVTVTLASGREACTLSTAVVGQIADADSKALVHGESDLSGRTVALETDAAFTIGVQWSNWCGEAPAAPIQLSLSLSGWGGAWAPISAKTAGTDPVPPCNGPGQPSSLSLTELQPQ